MVSPEISATTAGLVIAKDFESWLAAAGLPLEQSTRRTPGPRSVKVPVDRQLAARQIVWCP
jgi:hypothetical protein